MQQPLINRSLTNILLLSIGMILTPYAMAYGKGVAYISNQDGSVEVIDLETMEFKSTVDIGTKGPRGIGVVAESMRDLSLPPLSNVVSA